MFARLYDLDPEAEELKLADNGDMEGGEMKMSVSTTGPPPEEPSESEEPNPQDDNSTPEATPAQAVEQPPETPSGPRPACAWCTTVQVVLADSPPDRWSAVYS